MSTPQRTLSIVPLFVFVHLHVCAVFFFVPPLSS